MDIFGLDSNWVLVIVTAIYVILVWRTLEEMQKSRKVEFIEKQLENFYIPLQDRFNLAAKERSIAYMGLSKIYDMQDYDYTRKRVTALNEGLKDIQKYRYLASRQLKELIENFFNNVDSYTDTNESYSKMEQLLEKIETLILQDIKDYQKKLDDLTG